MLARQRRLKIQTLAVLVDAALVVGVLTILCACASSPRPLASHRVASCSATAAPGMKARAIPSIRVPKVVEIPSDASLYGVAISGLTTVFTAIGPVASKCVLSIGADGGSFLSIGHAPSDSISEVYVPGGATITTGWACEYVPQVMAAARALLGSGSECYQGEGYPYGEIVDEVPTHLRDTFITTVVVPPGVADGIIASQPSKVTIFAIFAVRMNTIDHKPAVTSSPEISCELPYREEPVCKASLDYFAATFLSASGAESPVASLVVAAINQDLGLAGHAGN
jgi:hypothetical protein